MGLYLRLCVQGSMRARVLIVEPGSSLVILFLLSVVEWSVKALQRFTKSRYRPPLLIERERSSSPKSSTALYTVGAEVSKRARVSATILALLARKSQVRLRVYIQRSRSIAREEGRPGIEANLRLSEVVYSASGRPACACNIIARARSPFPFNERVWLRQRARVV